MAGGGKFQLSKTWGPNETVKQTDLNAVLSGILQNLTPAKLDNFSANVSQMQQTQNPGTVGTEVLSADLSQELMALRYMLSQIIGGAQWYSLPPLSITSLNNNISGIISIPQSRIISGRVSSLGNNQPSFLVPDGTAATVYLKAASTNFVAFFNNTQQTFSADITTTGLSLAPGSNNTCTVNDSTLAGATATQQQAEAGTSIGITSIGSQITAIAGNFAAFKKGSEYFIAQMENGTNTYAAPTGNVGATFTATVTSGSPYITNVSSLTGLYVGMSVTGTGIPNSTTITAISGGDWIGFVSNAAPNGYTITISNNGSATNNSVTVTALGNKIANVSSLSGIAVGQTVTGTGLAANSVVTAISTIPDAFAGNTVTVSNTATSVGSSATYTFVWYRLLNAFRGVGFDSADAWISRATISNGDTITLMKLAWVFATYNSSTPGVAISYNKPIVSYAQPSAPSAGDFWYNLNTNTWEQFNGTSFANQVACFAGICIQDTAGCKAARSADFHKSYSPTNTLEPQFLDTTDVYEPSLSSKISVYGNQYYFQNTLPTWNLTTSLDSGVSISTTTTYYCYVTDLGDLKISNISPTVRKFDLLGAYHPAKPWRCVAQFTTDGSSHVTSTGVLFTGFHQQVFSPQVISASHIVNNTITRNQIASGTISGTEIGTATVNQSNMALRQAAISATASGGNYALSGLIAFNTTSVSYTGVTGASVTITTYGNPVEIRLLPMTLAGAGVAPSAGGNGIELVSSNAGSTNPITATLALSRLNPNIMDICFGLGGALNGSSRAFAIYPPQTVYFKDYPPPGTWTYTLSAAVSNVACTFYINGVMEAIEIK